MRFLTHVAFSDSVMACKLTVQVLVDNAITAIAVLKAGWKIVQRQSLRNIKTWVSIGLVRSRRRGRPCTLPVTGEAVTERGKSGKGIP